MDYSLNTVMWSGSHNRGQRPAFSDNPLLTLRNTRLHYQHQTEDHGQARYAGT